MDCDYILQLEYNWNVRYALQLLEMEKKKTVALIGSLQVVIASFISAFTALWNITGKLKEKLKYIRYILFPSLNPNVFVPKLASYHECECHFSNLFILIKRLL